MAATDDILSSLPIDQLASRLGASPDEVRSAASSAIPTLLGGLEANASNGGQDSLLDALGQHDPALVEGGVDLDRVDAADGQKIASHVFGSNEEQVYSALGSTGAGSSDLLKKLIPLLAPIVMSYLSKQVLGRAGAGGPSGTTSSAAGGSRGGLGDILGTVLGGALGGSSAGGGAGGGLGDILGGLLGAGRK